MTTKKGGGGETMTRAELMDQLRIAEGDHAHLVVEKLFLAALISTQDTYVIQEVTSKFLELRAIIMGDSR